MLADDDCLMIPYQIGDVFISHSQEETQEMLEEAKVCGHLALGGGISLSDREAWHKEHVTAGGGSSGACWHLSVGAVAQALSTHRCGFVQSR